LFDKTKAQWQGIIHERLLLEGRSEDLGGDLLHYTYRDISDHVARLNRYSTLLSRKKKNSLGLIVKAIASPPLTFLRHYLLRLGFLDGYAGLVIALISAQGTALKYLKAYEAKHEMSLQESGR